MITRRQVIRGIGGLIAGGTVFSGYAFGYEPAVRLVVTRYAVTPPQWPKTLNLKIAIIADLHACRPWVGPERIRAIVEKTNALGSDIILLLGDYVAGHRWVTDWVHSDDWSVELGKLAAPMGVHAILGNHDWWEDKTAQRNGHGPSFAAVALKRVGIPVYENDVVRLTKGDQAFWLAGLGDQISLLPGKKYGRKSFQGFDDLPGTLAKVTDNAPIILMAHEPDIFPKVPERVALTLSGHTHGGQFRVFGYSPVVPSRFGNRYAYGHVVEQNSALMKPQERHLIVSGGIGCSIAPVRFGVPPEIVVVELGGGGVA